MCQICGQPDNIRCNCQVSQPYCDQCGNDNACEEKMDAQCVFYHLNCTNPAGLTNLGIPCNTDLETILEALDDLVGNSLNIPFSGTETATIRWVSNGPAGHKPYAHVKISEDVDNAVESRTDGLYVPTPVIPAGGEVNAGVNIGTGEGQIYAGKTGVNLQFKTIKAGPNVTVTNNTNDVIIEAAGGITMTEVMLDVIDIRAFGGSGNGVTDNQPALLAAKASAPAGAYIWLKNRSNSIYYFNNTNPTLFDNVLLYIEDGVKVKLSQGTAVDTLKSVTPFTLKWDILGGQEHKLYPESWLPIKDNIETEILKDNVVVREPFDANNFVEHGFQKWTDETTFGPIPANLTINSTSHFTLTNVTGGTGHRMRVGVADAVPGGTISACARNSITSGFGIMWVENSYGVAISTDGGDFNIYKHGDPIDAISFSLPAGYPQELNDNGIYLNYNTSKAVCSIKLHEDGKSVEFLHNGVNMSGCLVTLGGLPITKWGFGSYQANSEWFDFILEYNRKKEPYEDIVVQVFGDSQTVEYVGTSWPTYLKRFINNSYGNRVTLLENYAVSGQTLEQQETVFNGTTHKGVTILLAGTNNIQGQTSVAAMLTSLSNMLTALDFTNNFGPATNGVIDPGKNRFLLVIPPMYFSQALNGGTGQASANYELGSTYRMAMLRWAADNDVQVVYLMTAFGATTMNSLLMRDDIHFSDLGAAVAAKEIAKGLLILKSKIRANEVLVGNDKSALHYVKSSTAPGDTATPVKWISVYQGGVEYKTPLYQ